MIFDSRIQFPSWLRRGPWPYEAGIALLLLWIAECVRADDVQVMRYAAQPWIKWLLVDNGIPMMMACWAVSVFLIVGLALLTSSHECRARPFRVAGLLGASIIFGILSVIFHATWAYSIGGGTLLLLTWRTFCVAVRVGLECKGDA